MTTLTRLMTNDHEGLKSPFILKSPSIIKHRVRLHKQGQARSIFSPRLCSIPIVARRNLTRRVNRLMLSKPGSDNISTVLRKYRAGSLPIGGADRATSLQGSPKKPSKLPPGVPGYREPGVPIRTRTFRAWHGRTVTGCLHIVRGARRIKSATVQHSGSLS